MYVNLSTISTWTALWRSVCLYTLSFLYYFIGILFLNSFSSLIYTVLNQRLCLCFCCSSLLNEFIQGLSQRGSSLFCTSVRKLQIQVLHFLYAFFSHVSKDLCLCYLIFNMNVSGGEEVRFLHRVVVGEDVSTCERETLSWSKRRAHFPSQEADPNVLRLDGKWFKWRSIPTAVHTAYRRFREYRSIWNNPSRNNSNNDNNNDNKKVLPDALMFLKSDIEGCVFGLFSFLCSLFRHQSFQTLPSGRHGADSSEVWRSAWVGVDAFSYVCVCVCAQLILKGCQGSLTRCQPAGSSALLYSTQFDISKLCYISLWLTAVPPFGKWAYLLSSRKTDTTLPLPAAC